MKPHHTRTNRTGSHPRPAVHHALAFLAAVALLLQGCATTQPAREGERPREPKCQETAGHKSGLAGTLALPTSTRYSPTH